MPRSTHACFVLGADFERFRDKSSIFHSANFSRTFSTATSIPANSGFAQFGLRLAGLDFHSKYNQFANRSVEPPRKLNGLTKASTVRRAASGRQKRKFRFFANYD